MSNLNIEVYAEGCLYPSKSKPADKIKKTISHLQDSGFTTLILSLFHIGRDYDISPPQKMGDIYYNNTLIISDGKYVGDKDWKDLIAGTIGGTITQTCASIGGASDVIYDFRTIQKIYEANGNSFSGTNLERNFNVLKSAFPDISIIDLDNEDNTDKASMVAFCEMLIGIGFDITFCPFTSQEFWNSCLAFLHASESYRGKVKWWNLQCYSGGTGNDPDTWATSIANEIPGFDTNGFIIPGASTDGGASGVQDLMKTFRGEKSVGGGFIWTLGNIINQYPSDPLTGMKAYVNAIKEGLTGTG